MKNESPADVLRIGIRDLHHQVNGILEVLQRDRNCLMRRCEDLTRENKLLSEKAENLEATLATLKVEHQGVEAEKLAVLQQLRELELERSRLEMSEATVEAARRELEIQLATVEEAKRKLENQVATDEAAARKLELQVATLERNKVQQLRDLNEVAYYAADIEDKLCELMASRSWRVMGLIRRITATLRSVLRGVPVDKELTVPQRPGALTRGLSIVAPLDTPLVPMGPASALGETQVTALRGKGEVSSRSFVKLEVPVDYHRLAAAGVLLPKFCSLKVRRKLPSGFPFDMTLPEPIGNKNDFGFLLEAIHQLGAVDAIPDIGMYVVTWVRCPEDGEAMMTALKNQTLPESQFEIITCLDYDETESGSWAERSMQGAPWKQDWDRVLSDAADDALIVFLDGTINPDHQLLERIARYAALSSKTVLSITDLKEVGTAGEENHVGARTITEEWRRSRFPFRSIKSLNFALPISFFRDIGGLESRFHDARRVAMELGYRAYNMGAYFLPIVMVSGRESRLSLPAPMKERIRIDDALFKSLCPVHWYRPDDGRYEVPKVSVYIPAYNASKFIAEAIDSVLTQNFQDLEVCVHVDGSPDDTLAVLESRYAEEKRVRWSSDKNAGIGHASNRAIALARGLYIAQLDADDRLKPGAIRRLVEVLDNNPDIGCAYSSCERIDIEGNYLQDEYSWPVFTREKMMLTSIVHHFRMFRRQAWERTEKFREDIKNAVDYDMFLKLSDVGLMHHVEEKLYQRRWHGGNTSSVNEDHQTKNTYVAQAAALERVGLDKKWRVGVPNPNEPRRVAYTREAGWDRVYFWPNYSRANPYQRALYRNNIKSADFIAGDIDVAIKVARESHYSRNVIFHVHWLNPLIERASSESELQKRLNEFISKIKKLQWLGGKVVWTIHNTISHESKFAKVERDFSSALAKTVDRIHIHARSSLEEIEEYFPVPAEKVRVSAHGSYIGIYPNYIPRALARQQLGLRDGDKVLLFVGQIRPYKGLKKLLEACTTLLSKHQSLRLILAGKANYDVQDELKHFGELSPRVNLINRHIEDSELQVLFNAADVGVFPYQRILTSGSLMLSLSFGLPVVMPDVGMVREVLDDKKGGLLYGDGCVDKDICEALDRALEMIGTEQWAQFQAHAMELGRSAVWPDFLHNMQLLDNVGDNNLVN